MRVSIKRPIPRPYSFWKENLDRLSICTKKHFPLPAPPTYPHKGSSGGTAESKPLHIREEIKKKGIIYFLEKTKTGGAPPAPHKAPPDVPEPIYTQLFF